MNQKGQTGILILVGILIIVAMAGGAYYFGKSQAPKPPPAPVVISTSPSPSDETVHTESDRSANWKTYTNTAYKYSISFPNNLKTQVQAAGAGVKEAPADALQFYIYDPSSSNDYLERYIEIAYFGLSPSVSKDFQKSIVKIGTLDAIKYTNSDPNGFDIYHVSIPNQSSILEITATKNPQKVQTMNEILSTFRFTQ